MGKFTTTATVLAVLLTTVASPSSVAQENSATEAGQPTAPENQKTAGLPPTQTDDPAQPKTEPPASKQPSAANDDVFTPTEEISEDLSVSFPVDI